MRRKFLTIAAALALWHGAACAQQVITVPAMGSSSTEAQDQPVSDQTEGFHILVVGDALGGGLGAGLMRMVQAEAGYDVTLRFTELSGIARPELYDWSETLPKLVEGKSFDAIVMLIGENDRQEIRAGDVRYGFGTPGWIAAYKAQLDKVIAALKATGSAVYWVSLPPMADAGYEAAMRQVTALQQERAVAAGLHFLDIRRAFLDANGAYSDHGPDETGLVRTLRGRDGVSFFKAGNNRLGQLVLAAIKTNASAPDVAAPAPPAAPAATILAAVPASPRALPQSSQSGQPLFGQSGDDNAGTTFRGEAASAVIATAGGAAPLSAIQSLAPPGSAAEELLVKGVAATAPAGRADDFTMPQK